jgi:hypothetical protein
MTRPGDPVAGGRGQATVVGVAVLLLVTVASLAALTAGVGVVVEEGASTAAADAVADGLAAVDTGSGGNGRTTVPLAGGRLAVEPRTIRVSDRSGTVATYRADAVVYEAGDRRVALLLGVVVRGTGADATLRRPPPVTASGGALVLGVPVLAADSAGSASGTGRVALQTEVGSRHRRLGPGSYRVAVETAAPGAWERALADRDVRTDRVDRDGDGVESVVAHYPGVDEAHLVVHEVALRLEVRA